jgi:hypothetical protein
MESYLQSELNKYVTKAPKQKIAIFLMGIPGSGKTSCLEKFINNILGLLLYHIYIVPEHYDFQLTNFINCNPDLIKDFTDQRDKSNKNDDLSLFSIHNNKLLNYILSFSEPKYNFILDGTGYQFGHYLQKIKRAQELNYFTILIDTRTDILKCYERVLNRERKVNFNTIERLYNSIYTPKTYPHYYHKYENMNNYDILEESVDLSVIIDNNSDSIISSFCATNTFIQEELSDFMNIKI